MHFSAYSKGSILVSSLAIITIFSTLMVTLAAYGPTTRANSDTTYPGTHSTITTVRPLNFPQSTQGVQQTSSSHPSRQRITGPFVLKHDHITGAGAPQADDMRGPSAPSTGLLHNFNGISDLDNTHVLGAPIEPPDQGLCVGNLTGKAVVGEIVNEAITFYTPAGKVVSGPTELNTFFGEPPFSSEFVGDPRCYFDAATKTFFLTIFATDNFTTESHVDIAVLPSDGAGFVFALNTTDSSNPKGTCPCFGDQPLLGIDQNNVYISVNEANFSGTIFNGAALYAISKSQLLAGHVPVNVASFVNLTLAGAPILELQPAITNSSAEAEFLLNSFVIAAAGIPIPTSNNLGLWALTNGEAVTTGGIPTLSATVITSELYVFPVPAASTGGTFLTPNDDRMQQVQFINGYLFAALDTAVSLSGASVALDGVAWFQVKPQLSGGTIAGGTLKHQGYIAASGQYLLYPAIEASKQGETMAIVFTDTSTTLNPSAAYVLHRPSDGGDTAVKPFSKIQIAAQGVSSYDPNGTRWGDYSGAVMDPDGTNIWLATEYIPPLADQSTSFNWGTRIFEVKGV